MPRKKKLRRIGVIDCETDPFEPGVFVVPFLWGALLDTGEYFEFEEIPALIEWMAAQDDLILYAHNGGKFDYHFLREYIESDEVISVVAGRLARAKIGRVELRDSLNLFGQTRLADFSKKEIDYRKMRKSERRKPEVWAEIREYLKYDCESLMRLVMGFIEKFGLQFTQAGAAMRYWQRHHAPRTSDGKGEIPRSSQGFYDRFSQYYYGGRVQCFAHGHAQEKFSVVDINSAYPYAMTFPHPYSTSYLHTTRLPKLEESWPQMLVTLDAIAKGCFPLRANDGSLWFPEDEKQVRTYHVTGWELVAALETNSVTIIKIRDVFTFGTPVAFGDYVRYFFELRKDAKARGDKAQDIFAKIFLNALYGKFAANPRKYQEFILSEIGSEHYKRWIASGYVDENVIWGGRQMLVRPLPEAKHRYFNVATGGSITGFVRAHLWKALNKVSRPLYCDTDSISAGDVSQIDTGDALGQWKIEVECDEYAIGGKKLYAFHKEGASRELYVRRQMPLDTPEYERVDWDKKRKSWKVACKGSDLSPGEIIDVATGSTVTHFSQVPNYSVHKANFSFINREVRSTYRDIAKMDEAA